MKRFTASVEHITGQELDVKPATESDAALEHELETLRAQVDDLSDEVGYQSIIFSIPILLFP